MKKVILRYGTYGALAELIFFVLTWVIIYITGMGHKAQGYIGWIDLICPLAFVYLGTRYYRDKVNNGSITFMQALKVGILIVLIPALAYGLIETVYVTWIDPHFYENIAKYDLEQYRKTLSPSQFDAKMKAMHQQMLMNKNPLFNFCMMVISIVALGTIVTVISSLLLKKQAKQESFA
jgi:hypothetical protein